MSYLLISPPRIGDGADAIAPRGNGRRLLGSGRGRRSRATTGPRSVRSVTPPPADLTADFDELSAGVPATIGIAVASPDGSEPVALGPWSSGVSWSTIKVPLAIAALSSKSADAHDLVVKAITESDNHASERLWSRLGKPTDAAQRVQAVIRTAGDGTTVVESRRLRTGFTAFGQTQWPLDRQARFAARLPYIAGAAPVIDLMHRITAHQRWGLAANGMPAKGGWGPGVHGDYLVRQFGIMPTEAGHVGVALAAETRAFETGVEVLATMTDWLFAHLPALTGQ